MNEKIIVLANKVYKLVNDDFKLGIATKAEAGVVADMIQLVVAMKPEDELLKRRQMILGKLVKLQERLAA